MHNYGLTSLCRKSSSMQRADQREDYCLLHAQTQWSSGRVNHMPSKPAGKQQLSIPSACFQEGGCSQSFRYPHRASPQHYSNFFCLPPHALTPSHLLSHLPVSLPAHSHFPYSLQNPPIFTFLIHLPVQLHNPSLKHLQYTQGEELCFPRPTCLCLCHQHPHALHPSRFPKFEGR